MDGKIYRINEEVEVEVEEGNKKHPLSARESKGNPPTGLSFNIVDYLCIIDTLSPFK